MSKYVFTNHYYAVLSFAITRKLKFTNGVEETEKGRNSFEFHSFEPYTGQSDDKQNVCIWCPKQNFYVLPISTIIKQNNPTHNIRINVEFILIIPIHSYLIIPYTNTLLINYSNTPRKFCFLSPTCKLHKSRRQDQTLGLMVHRLSAHFLAQWPLLQQNVQFEKKTTQCWCKVNMLNMFGRVFANLVWMNRIMQEALYNTQYTIS